MHQFTISSSCHNPGSLFCLTPRMQSQEVPPFIPPKGNKTNQLLCIAMTREKQKSVTGFTYVLNIHFIISFCVNIHYSAVNRADVYFPMLYFESTRIFPSQFQLSAEQLNPWRHLMLTPTRQARASPFPSSIDPVCVLVRPIVDIQVPANIFPARGCTVPVTATPPEWS